MSALTIADLFGRLRWRSTESAVIDWSIPVTPIAARRHPLAPNTMRRIEEGLRRFGGAFGIALVVEYYGNGVARPVTEPLPTVTCTDRFGLVTASGREIGFRMLQPHELAAAQGFPGTYQFAGTKTEQVRQIGNAVPCGLARAIVGAALAPCAAVKEAA